MTKQGQYTGCDLARNTNEVLLVDRAFTANDSAGDGTILGEYKKSRGVDIEAPRRSEVQPVFLAVFYTAAVSLVSGCGTDQRCSVLVTILGLTGHVAKGFVKQDGNLISEFAVSTGIQRQSLAWQYFLAQLGDTLAVNKDKTATYKVIRFPAGADSPGGQEFADAYGFIFGEIRGQQGRPCRVGSWPAILPFRDWQRKTMEA